MKRLIFVPICLFCLCASGQETKPFEHLDLGLTIGTTGIGLELKTPVHNIVNIRTGVDYMPPFSYGMDFGLHLGDDQRGKYILDANGKPKLDANGNPQLTTFGRLAEKLQEMTQYEVDDKVTMEGHPTLVNFKFLVDVHPFKNKKWRLTAGFYAGSTRIAKGQNTLEDAPSLFAVSIYNNIYERVKNEEPVLFGAELPPDISERIINYGQIGMVLGTYSRDIVDEGGNVLHQKGESYRMLPGKKDMMVRTRLMANAVRPYLGFGYGGPVSHSKRVDCSFDAGLLYVGDIHVYTHDGTCLSHDVEQYGHSIKGAMDFFNAVKVYPVLNFRLAYRLF